MYKKLPNGQIIYEEDYSCVLDPKGGKGGIFIGNLEAAQNLNTLRKNNIRAVLTAAKGVNINHPKSQVPFYLQIQGEDRDGFDLTRFFSQAINFIRDSLEQTNIMVHCLAGVSRSVCLVLAYLMKDHHMSYNQAYSMVKGRRKIIHPNDGFIRQLKQYELELRKNGSYTPKKSDEQISPYHKNYSASPNKKRYDYYAQLQNTEPYLSKFRDSNYKPDSKVENLFSPSKYSKDKEIQRITQNYIPRHEYESPVKRPSSTLNYGQRNHRVSQFACQSPRRYRQSPTKYELQYSPNKLNSRKISAYQLDKRGEDRRDYQVRDSYGAGRQTFIDKYGLDPKKEMPNRTFGQNTTNLKYSNYKQASASDLSQELDRKIAKIREKYTQYTRTDLKMSRRGRQKELIRDYDENDLMGSLKMKKITSDIEHRPNNNPEIGLIRSNYLKSSGLQMKRMSSLKEGYY